MAKKVSLQKSRAERLMERLSKHPELMERFEAILDVTESGTESGPIPTIDDIEDRLVTEVRKLGNSSMKDWAQKLEERTAGELLKEKPKARVAKKK